MAVRVKRSGGRQVPRAEVAEIKEIAGPETPLRAGQCRAYMRQRLAVEFRGIVEGFLKEAKSGSCQHVKLVTELLELPARKRSKSKGSVQRLLEQMDREDERRAGGR